MQLNTTIHKELDQWGKRANVEVTIAASGDPSWIRRLLEEAIIDLEIASGLAREPKKA